MCFVGSGKMLNHNNCHYNHNGFPVKTSLIRLVTTTELPLPGKQHCLRGEGVRKLHGAVQYNNSVWVSSFKNNTAEKGIKDYLLLGHKTSIGALYGTV